MSHTTAIFGPPGTGKTQFLVNEIRKMDTTDMAVVSFSKAAAAELTSRCSKKPAFIGTIHSYCFNQLGYERSQVVETITEREQMEFMPGIDLRDINRAIEIGQFARRKGYFSFLDAFHACDDLSIPADIARTIWVAYTKWKEYNGFIDFDDMLVNAVGHVKKFPIVVVDEAQDLSPLQWNVVRSMVKLDGTMVVAGDDDQAIFTWAGADPHGMIKYRNVHKVLEQSYRVPVNVHRLANEVIHRIHQRKEKNYKPTASQGYVAAGGEYNPDDYPFPHTVMCRDRYVMRDVEELLRETGYLYKIEGAHGPGTFMSRRAKAVRAAWTKDMETLHTLKSALTRDERAMVEADEIPDVTRMIFDCRDDEQDYIRRTIKGKPENIRITLSTIHAQKGKEFDHGVLIAHCSPRVESMQEKIANFDDEIRVWYTAITRVKKGVTIIGTNPFIG